MKCKTLLFSVLQTDGTNSPITTPNSRLGSGSWSSRPRRTGPRGWSTAPSSRYDQRGGPRPPSFTLCLKCWTSLNLLKKALHICAQRNQMHSIRSSFVKDFLNIINANHSTWEVTQLIHTQRVTVCCYNPIGQGLVSVLVAHVVVVVIVVICEKSGGALWG